MSRRPRPAAPDPVRERLRELVRRDGRTVAAIAAAAELSRPLVYDVLNGYRHNPSVRTVGSLLRALGARWADLD